jgi:hypothetical protein
LEGLKARIDRLTEELDNLTSHYAEVRKEAVKAGEVEPQPAEREFLRDEEIAEAETAMGQGSALERHVAMQRSMSLKVARMRERASNQPSAQAIDFSKGPLKSDRHLMAEEGDE